MRSIRWKLAVTSLITVAIPIFLLTRYAVDNFDLYTRTALEGHMVDVAFLAGDMFLAQRSAEELYTILCNYTERTDTRIQLLSPQGVVLLDTVEPSSVGEDLSEIPEVTTAMAGFYEARPALTKDRRFMYYYCAQPILSGGDVQCIVYVSRHTDPIIQAIFHMKNRHRAAMIWALLGAAAIAVLFAYTLTRRLRRLTKTTSAFARGETETPVHVGGRDEIGELGAAFVELGKELAQREADNRDLISTTLHELRAPVTAIRGAAELLEQGAADKPEAREKFLGNIRYQADRLIRLSGELADLTRLEAESGRGTRDVLDFCEAMRGIVDRLRPAFDEERARLETTIPGISIPVRLHVERIEQVVGNLLENAFRYTPPQGRVHLLVERIHDGEVRTTVQDEGPGIASSNLPHVFDRFFTTEPKDVYRGYGSGLGLAIARSIVESHKGRLWVESQPGHGAAFHFTLPIERV